MSNYDSANSPWASVSRIHKIIALILAAILLITWWLGRNGTLGCPTAGTTVSAAAPAAVASAPAPAPIAVAASDASLGWEWLDGKLRLTGTVKDEETRKAVVEAAVKRMGSAAKVDDQLKVSSSVGALSFLGRLADISNWGVDGRGIKFSGDSVTLTGTVPVEGEKKQRGEAAALYFGSGVKVDNQIQVQAPGRPEPVSLYFDTGKADVQGDAKALLAKLIAYGNASPNSKLQLSGFHDKRGNADANKLLAKNRALAVRDLLKGAGLAEDRMVLVPPTELVGDADDKQARRVDVSIAQ